MSIGDLIRGGLAGNDDPISMIERAAQINYAAHLADTIFQGRGEHSTDPHTASTFQATFLQVTVITRDGGLRKARIHYQAGNEDEPECLDTDPLGHPWPDWLHQKAKTLAPGEPVVIVKRNAHDPTGKTSQGFRRIIWLEPTTLTAGF